MTSKTARAFWITGPGRGEIRSVAVAAPGPEEVEIETRFSAVSRGTESLVFTGRVPTSEFERMRAPYQEGDFPWPVKYGYCNVGRVVAGAESLLGRTVFCLYPHQSCFVVPVGAVTIVPDEVPAARAVLAPNLETAVNGIWDSAPAIGDRIAVVGAGTVGCLVAWLAASIRGTRVELIDIDPARASAAEALGVAFRAPAEATRDADLVIHASGAADGLRLALALAGFEARIVELSWFGADSVALPLGEAFHSRRLQLVSSQVAHVAAGRRARWDHRRRMGLVMELLANAVLDTLITGESGFDELPEVMPALAAGRDGTLCHRIAYRQAFDGG